MSQPVTKHLQLNGANLCFEVAGSGPYIVFVAGANCTAGVFYPIRDQLKSNFTVVTYDRRGFSRSEITGEQDYTNRINTDVDDIYQMMKSLTSEKFFIFGSSSGGVLSLQYVVTRPETIIKAFIHEPALLDIMLERLELKQMQFDIYDLYTNMSREAALIKFSDFYCNESDRQLMRFSQGASDPQRVKNSDCWFEHELRQYPTNIFDWEKVKACKSKLIPLLGVENKGFFLQKPVTRLAELTGANLLGVSGGHLGYTSHAQQVAK